MELTFRGVLPAVTTPFDDSGDVDHAFLAKHASWLVDNGCDGVVLCGSLGEGASLAHGEKVAMMHTAVAALAGRAPVVAAIAATSTGDAVRLAQDAAAAGCSGLMVLPPYVYLGDDDEIAEHMSAVFAATPLPCMLYNNPLAYGTDVVPEAVARLAERNPNLVAVKESSADVRRVTHLAALAADRLVISVGVDDLAVEAARAGATGWIAGLANAIPRESVWIFQGAQHGVAVDAAYAATLPLMRLDTVVKFVQLIKAAQAGCNAGSSRVRPPRLALTAAEQRVVDDALMVLREQRPTDLPFSTPCPSTAAVH